jgi:hypothetical protein
LVQVLPPPVSGSARAVTYLAGSGFLPEKW